MERYEERYLGMYTRCTRCRKPMASGQKAYVRIIDDGTVVRIGAPICYECRNAVNSGRIK